MESKTILIGWTEGNATPCVTEAMGRLKAGGVISFEKGIYHFRKEGSHKKDVRAINIAPGVKHVIFDMEELCDVTIDGNGSEFIFDDIVFPFALQRCRHVTLRNFTIDFSFSRYCQGTVVQSDEGGFELAIDHSHFKADVDEKGHVIFHSSDLSVSTEERPILLGNVVFGKPPWDYVFAGDSLHTRENLPTSYVETDAAPTPRGICFTYREGSRRLVFQHGEGLLFCYEPRCNVNILAAYSEDIHVENVSIYRGGGMGIVAARTRDFFLDNVAIQVRPGRNEARSTTADGVFLVQCDGTVSIKNSLIADTLDDALNIHGIYDKVCGISSNTLLVMEGREANQGFMFCEAGDCLECSDGEMHRSKGAFKVLAAKKLGDGRIQLQLDGDCSSLAIGDIVENQSRVATFIFEDNKVSDCPHLRISDNGTIRIRRNLFDGINCILVRDLLRYWFESGAVTDMLIEGNTFLNTPQAGGGYAINIGSTRNEASDICHRNITIRGNRIVSPNGHAVAASRVDGLVIQDNVFEGGMQETMLHISNCLNTRCEKNSFSCKQQR